MLRLAALALLTVQAGGPQPTPGTAAVLRVAAASDLRFALDEALGGFRAAHPGLAAEAVYGSSGAFFAQIREGAPFDVFLSADADYADRLFKDDLAEAPFPYAVGRLALVVRKDSGFDPRGFAELVKGAGIRRIAIANPAHAPYGRAAEAALRSWKIYDAVALKLVFGESVSQAAQYVDAGAAQAGLVALALARAKGSSLAFAEVPQDAYPPLNQSGVVLKRTRMVEAARAFQQFLTSESARAILSRYGFALPPPR